MYFTLNYLTGYWANSNYSIKSWQSNLGNEFVRGSVKDSVFKYTKI